MRIHRIEVAHWRRFDEEPRVFEPAPGATIISGPNESGKSTLFEAVRAGLFDVSESQGAWVDEISPWGSAGAAPSVELEFESDAGDLWRIRKEFGRRGTALLERFEDEAWRAEARNKPACHRVVEILGGSAPTRGKSSPRDWGALRWLFMPDVERALPSADDDPVQGLEVGVSCISPLFDRVAERARKEFSRWFTPKGRDAVASELVPARAELARAVAEAAELRETVARTDAQRDRHRELAAEQPGSEALYHGARRTVEELAEQMTALGAERARIETLAAKEKHARERVHELRTRIVERGRLRDDLREAESRLAAGLEARTREELRAAAAREALERAEAAQAAASEESVAARRDLEHARLRRRLERAHALDRAIAEAESSSVEGPDELMVTEARRLEAARDRLRATAAAGSLDVALDGVVGARVLADGAEIDGDSGKALEVVTIELADGGRITVRSPVADAALAAREADIAAAALDEILAAWSVGAVSDLEALARSARDAAIRLDAARNERRVFDDASTRDLEADVRALEAETTRTTTAPLDDETVRALVERERRALQEFESCRVETEALRLARTEADAAHARTRADETAAASSVAERREALEKHRETGSSTALERAVVEAEAALEAHGAERTSLEERLGPRLQELTAAHRDAVERRDAAETRARSLAGELAALASSLDDPTASGAWTDLGRAEAEVVRLESRVHRLETRARAARMAKDALDSVRAESSRAILDPVSRRLREYVAEVTEGRWGVVELDGNLHPAKLGVHEFSQGSEGLRELVAALVRVCVAVDLAERGPQCLILDDPCAHVSSDRLRRFARLLRTILDACENLQLIVLTNRPQEFRELEGERITLGEGPEGGPSLRLRA